MPGQEGKESRTPLSTLENFFHFLVREKLGEFFLCVFYDKAFAFRLAGLQEGVETAASMYTLG